MPAWDEKAIEIKHADVAELVDARDLKSLDGNVVWVRVPPPAPVGLLPLFQPLAIEMVVGFVAMLWLQDWSNVRSASRGGSVVETAPSFH